MKIADKNGTAADRLPPIAGEGLELVPILLVDDREENLVALEAVLRDPGYRISKVTSGDDCLRFLLDKLPALILLDVQMPGLDGFETAAIIKGNPRTRDIPIIFVTAINTDERFTYRGYEHGAIDYIYKPFDAQVLRSKVAVLADLYRKTDRLLKAEKSLRESEARDRERRIAELELRALRRERIEQKRYRNLVESLENGIVWSADPESLSPNFVSGSAARLTGHGSEELLADPGLFLQLIDERDRAQFTASARQAAQSHTEVRLEHRIRSSEGRVSWFHTSLRSSPRADGNGLELCGLSVDVTAMKTAERTLATAKRRSDILSHASLLLAESLEAAAPLRELLRFLQAKLFDVCLLEAFDVAPGIVVAATGNDLLDERIQETFSSYPARISDRARQDWAAGRTRVWPNPGESGLLEISGHEARAEALAGAGIHSAVQLGLACRGRLLGVLTLARKAGSPLTEEDVSLAEDIASRISGSLENSSLYQKAESAIRLRDEFLSIASHELRTPLTPLKIRVQQMQRMLDGRRTPTGAFPVEQLGKTVETCHRQIERLSKLVDDLLDISRISRGKLSLHAEAFDLAELVRDIQNRFSGQLEAAGCEVKLQLESPLEVTLDLSRVEQVIVNLLTNAIKYAPGQPIEIGARSEGDEVEINVRDHGIGIAAEDQARIFQRFERAVSSNHFGGLGLGLYIVSQILAAHGGRISVSSNPGDGATFSVRLPRRIASGASVSENAG
jgi:PAS domain S-box-containing protein